MSDLSLLLISGALRQGSTNRKLLAEAARLFGPAEVRVANLALPLYDGDLEDKDGIPPMVQDLSDAIAAADGVVISSPEYNKAIPGVLKNALDWVSRTKGGPWAGKPVALISAAAGRTGGETGSFTVRHALTPFRPRFVMGPPVMVADSGNAFDAEGRLISERYEAALQGLMDALRAEIALT